MRSGRRRQLAPDSLIAQRALLRAKVEHPFLHVKRHFGSANTRCRGLSKNHERLALLLGLADLLIAEPQPS